MKNSLGFIHPSSFGSFYAYAQIMPEENNINPNFTKEHRTQIKDLIQEYRKVCVRPKAVAHRMKLTNTTLIKGKAYRVWDKREYN